MASSHWASASAVSVDELAGREISKGLGFVGLTGLLLGIGAFALFRRLRDAHDRLVEQREALIGADRAALAAHLASSIAHDFNNQLAIAVAALEGLGRYVDDDSDGRESLADLKEALQGSTRLAKNLSKLGEQTLKSEAGPVDLASVALDALRIVRRHPHLVRCRIEQELEPVEVRGAHPTLLAQALINLLINAGQATGGAGCVRLRVGRDGDAAVVEVHDDGPGIPDELAERIFEPFFTTKREGTGLGLLSVKTCVERSGGNVRVAKSPLGGACFQLRFVL